MSPLALVALLAFKAVAALPSNQSANRALPIVSLGRHPMWCANGSASRGAPLFPVGPMNASAVVARKAQSLKTDTMHCTNPSTSRLANGLIIYCVCRIMADSLRLGLTFAFNGRSNGGADPACRNVQRNYFPSMRNVSADPADGHRPAPPSSTTAASISAVIAPCPKELRGTAHCDRYLQQYNLLRGHRALVRSYTRPAPRVRARNRPGAEDLVIHVRLEDLQAPVSFYTTLLAVRADLLGPVRGTVWLVTEDRRDPKVAALARALRAEVRATPHARGCGAAEDWAFLTAARRLVLGYGSYSWLAGFASDAVEVHLPLGGALLQSWCVPRWLRWALDLQGRSIYVTITTYFVAAIIWVFLKGASYSIATNIGRTRHSSSSTTTRAGCSTTLRPSATS